MLQKKIRKSLPAPEGEISNSHLPKFSHFAQKHPTTRYSGLQAPPPCITPNHELGYCRALLDLPFRGFGLVFISTCLRRKPGSYCNISSSGLGRFVQCKRLLWGLESVLLPWCNQYCSMVHKRRHAPISYPEPD